MPFLDFGEVQLAQSPALMRFAAKLAGLDGASSGDPSVTAVVDMVADKAIEFFECKKTMQFQSDQRFKNYCYL
jgi:hypothetical protein